MKSLSIPIRQTLPSVTPKIRDRYIFVVPSIGFGAFHELLLFLGPAVFLFLVPKGSGLGFTLTDGRLRGTGVYLVDL